MIDTGEVCTTAARRDIKSWKLGASGTLTTSGQLETAPESRARGPGGPRTGRRGRPRSPGRERPPPAPAEARARPAPSARPPSAHEATARLPRPEGPPRPSPRPARPGLPPPPGPRRRRARRLPGPEPRRAALTHLSFSVPKMEAKYSAISHRPPPPTPLPTPPTLPDARRRRHPDATTLAPPRRRGGAAQSDETLPARGRNLARVRVAPPPRPGSPRAARRRPLVARPRPRARARRPAGGVRGLRPLLGPGSLVAGLAEVREKHAPRPPRTLPGGPLRRSNPSSRESLLHRPRARKEVGAPLAAPHPLPLGAAPRCGPDPGKPSGARKGSNRPGSHPARLLGPCPAMGEGLRWGGGLQGMGWGSVAP